MPGGMAAPARSRCEIAELPFVNSACVVTGRFDIIVDVVVAGDVADLYRVTSELIPGVGEPGEITRTETFVVMAACNKWVSYPRAVGQVAQRRLRARCCLESLHLLQ